MSGIATCSPHITVKQDIIVSIYPVLLSVMLLQKAVTSEDMFLGMGNKNPATASCEDMVVRLFIYTYAKN